MNAVIEKKLEPSVYNFHPNKDAMHEREEMSSNYYQQRKGIYSPEKYGNEGDKKF